MKKAAIVVAASAAALLAVSPLAFAGDKGGDHGHWEHGHGGHGANATQVNDVESGSHSTGLIALGDVNALDNLNVCPAIPVGVGIGNLLGILGTGSAPVAPSTDNLTCTNDNSLDQDNNG